MDKYVVIGLGGSGSDVVSLVAEKLIKENRSVNKDDVFCAAINDFRNDSLKEKIVLSIPLFRDLSVKEFCEKYKRLMPESFCPQGVAFFNRNFCDGMSGSRIFGRMGFIDCFMVGEGYKLISLLFKAYGDGKNSINVIVTGSLAGGLGSGIFIQLALWIKNVFHDIPFNMRAMLILPEVFDGSYVNEEQRVNMKSNTYAALSELNTITKVMVNGSDSLKEEIRIDELFDSKKKRNCGAFLYDKVFLFGKTNQNGVSFSNITECCEYVAQCVYAQFSIPVGVYWPSLENFPIGRKNPEYCAMGVSAVEYPIENVKRYCIYRAMQDYIEYMLKLKNSYEAGEIEDPELVIALRDTNTRDIIKLNGEDVYPQDRAELFIKNLEKQIKGCADSFQRSRCMEMDYQAFLSETQTKEQLLAFAEQEDYKFERALDELEHTADVIAFQMHERVFPVDFNKINPRSKMTIYGLLSNENTDDFGFINLLAAKSVIEKILNLLSVSKNKYTDFSSVLTANGFEFSNSFARKNTKTVYEYFESKHILQSNEKFIQEFKNQYIDFQKIRIRLFLQYSIQRIEQELYSKLKRKAEILLDEINNMFNEVNEETLILIKKLIEENCCQIEDGLINKAYVMGERKEKESLYRSIVKDVKKSYIKLNEALIEAVYKRSCKKIAPYYEDDCSEQNLRLVFADKAYKTFYNVADTAQILDMDIFAAILRSVQGDAQKANAKLQALKTEAYQKSSPYLCYKNYDPKNLRKSNFFVYNIAIAKKYDYVEFDGNTIFAEKQSERYFWCFQMNDGLCGENLPEIDEANGAYYKCYCQKINEINNMPNERRERAFDFPHIDKNWHNILPPV